MHVVCSLNLRLLVLCTTGEIDFSGCRLTEVSLSRVAVLASAACLLVYD